MRLVKQLLCHVKLYREDLDKKSICLIFMYPDEISALPEIQQTTAQKSSSIYQGWIIQPTGRSFWIEAQQ